jgi:predicted DNA-binding WGR domain protein
MPDEHSPVRHTLALRRIDPEQNLSRFYTLVIERDLFGQVVLVRPWGRIGGGAISQICRRERMKDLPIEGI